MFDKFEYIFESGPDGKVVCDPEGRILRINRAALNLFGLSSERPYLGMPYRQFLQLYKVSDEQRRATSPEPWLLSLILGEDATADSHEELRTLQISPVQQVYVDIRCWPLLDSRKEAIGTLVLIRNITHQCRKALHLQRVHQALLTLVETIARIPAALERVPLPSDLLHREEMLLLSPPVLFVAQQLVDLIRCLLDCQKAALFATIPPEGRVYYLAGSGFTAEQEQYRREVRGRFLPSDFFEPEALARLSANQEVIFPADQWSLPPGHQEAFEHQKLLCVPLVLHEQPAGLFLIAKEGLDSQYTAEEVAFVQVVAAQSLLVMEYLHCWYKHKEKSEGELARQEIDQLANEFLNLASHELKTPLTVIKGNIQLAQRRIAKLRQQIEEQPERAGENVAHIQQALTSASQSARAQERMINDLIDAARIQVDRLELNMKRCDLLALLRTAIAEQQRLAPDRTIVLDTAPAEKEVRVNADAERVKQVITTYLANALKYSPADQPVTVQLTRDDRVARIAVHDEGPGIPLKEQPHLWDRFYRGKGASIQHELDLSLGLGLYLCKVFIERHHGSVGVQSETNQGVTFWFTLPLMGK
jgi:signal transduction histidine kinase